MDPLYKTYREKRVEAREKATQYVYYAVIFIASVIALVFLPLLSSTIGLDWAFPTTSVGWALYIFTRVSVALINVLIFFSFIQQAKINVKDEPNYKKAEELLGKVKLKIYIPRDPKSFLGKEYAGKGITIFISTALATIALTQAILSYDVATMLTYLVTIVMGIIFGIIEMLKCEDYWTQEYLDYAVKKIKDISEANGADYLNIASNEVSSIIDVSLQENTENKGEENA